MTMLERIIHVELAQAGWFVVCVVVFTLLAKFSPAHPGQKLLRSEWKVDLEYWFILPLFYTPLSLVTTTLTLHLAEGGDTQAVRELLGQGRAPVNSWPLWLQLFSALLISDVAQYFWHRAFHSRWLWKWHAVHHMPTEIDWLSSVRFHPVNIIISVMLTTSIVMVIGFSPHVFVYLVPFNILYSGLVHANLDWQFGPLKYVIASPVFHRWHHTYPELGGNKNFAPTFAFLDVIFGTFYMPSGDSPDAHPFGARDDIPKGRFLGQLLWPFRG